MGEGMPELPSIKEFEAVLFDVDGTLVDSLGTLVKGLGDTFENFNGARPSDQEIRATIGLPLTQQMAMFRDEPPSGRDIQDMAAYAIDRFSDYQHLEFPFAPAVQALKRCKSQGALVALVTSKSAVELAAFLQRFEAADALDATVCASDVQRPKPNPESALLACRRLGVEPSRSVMIGDSVFDIRCAQGAGVAAFAVAYGSTPSEELAREHPDALFDSPESLLAWASRN